MSRQSTELKVIRSSRVSDVLPYVRCAPEYPYSEEMISLCKRGNSFRQEYYYIECGEDYAFFILYYHRLNVFTLGTRRLYMNVKMIGYPCSLSCCGYITNNPVFMLDHVKTIKGLKIVLNVTDPVKIKGTVLGETLPTCVLKLRSESAEEYLNSMRSPYRRRILAALKRCQGLTDRIVCDNSVDVHALYMNTYEKSGYQLECLNRDFFEDIDADKIVFFQDGRPVGFILLKEDRKKLFFLFCGMDYSYPAADLYYCMLYRIVRYAIEHHCGEIDFGQTSENTKMRFGAVLQKRFFTRYLRIRLSG